MAHTKPASLFYALVYKWQVPGEKRVLSATGDTFLINANGVDGVIEKATFPASLSSLYYFDNPFDEKCNSHYMEINLTRAGVINGVDTTMTHQHLSLNVYPNEVPTEATEAHVFKVADIAYVRATPDSYSSTQSHVWIRSNEGFKVKRYRVAHTLAEILALVA